MQKIIHYYSEKVKLFEKLCNQDVINIHLSVPFYYRADILTGKTADRFIFDFFIIINYNKQRVDNKSR